MGCCGRQVVGKDPLAADLSHAWSGEPASVSDLSPLAPTAPVDGRSVSTTAWVWVEGRETGALDPPTLAPSVPAWGSRTDSEKVVGWIAIAVVSDDGLLGLITLVVGIWSALFVSVACQHRRCGW